MYSLPYFFPNINSLTTHHPWFRAGLSVTKRGKKHFNEQNHKKYLHQQVFVASFRSWAWS